MLNSYARPLCAVTLPPMLGRQVYMHSFDASAPSMPEGCEDYRPSVVALLASAGIQSGTIHMTIDEKVVRAGQSQRRPGPHVDGCFIPSAESWGHGGGSGGWNHGCNNIPTDYPGRMPVIVAASVEGCKVWEGQFDAEPKSDGDLSHLELGEGVVVPANVGYLLSPDCVHESMTLPRDIPRTFLRLALPVGSVSPGD
jgi:hypothetical protein